jgi:hypothetical protein
MRELFFTSKAASWPSQRFQNAGDANKSIPRKPFFETPFLSKNPAEFRE